jgi:hypothetical protein
MPSGAKALISWPVYGTAKAVPFVLMLFPQPVKPSPAAAKGARLKPSPETKPISFQPRENCGSDSTRTIFHYLEWAASPWLLWAFV